MQHFLISQRIALDSITKRTTYDAIIHGIIFRIVFTVKMICSCNTAELSSTVWIPLNFTSTIMTCGSFCELQKFGECQPAFSVRGFCRRMKFGEQPKIWSFSNSLFVLRISVTSTAFSISTNKISGRNNTFSTTLTFTEPQRMAIIIHSIKIDNLKFVKFFPYQIFDHAQSIAQIHGDFNLF